MPKWDEEKSDEERYHHIRPEGVEDMRRLDAIVKKKKIKRGDVIKFRMEDEWSEEVIYWSVENVRLIYKLIYTNEELEEMSQFDRQEAARPCGIHTDEVLDIKKA